VPRALGEHPPQGFARWLARFPLWIYRLRLGFLLGNRFLMLTHIGRKSGLPRQTVLEVVRHDDLTNSYVVASGWGEQSNWFRNILQTPQVTLTVGFRRLGAVAVRLSPKGAEHEFRDYARRHPRAFRALSSAILAQPSPDTDENCHSLAQSIPVVVFQPTGKW
jgi:deazaflavin-dependent oxidoreductase (nitroreductase family)